MFCLEWILEVTREKKVNLLKKFTKDYKLYKVCLHHRAGSIALWLERTLNT